MRVRVRVRVRAGLARLSRLARKVRRETMSAALLTPSNSAVSLRALDQSLRMSWLGSLAADSSAYLR